MIRAEGGESRCAAKSAVLFSFGNGSEVEQPAQSDTAGEAGNWNDYIRGTSVSGGQEGWGCGIITANTQFGFLPVC